MVRMIAIIYTYLSSKDLVDSGRLFESALVDNLRPHVLHEQHEGVQRLLDVKRTTLSRGGGEFVSRGG